MFEHVESGIASELHTYVAMDAPVKFAVIKLSNKTNKPRRLSLIWLLGTRAW